jgi:hypothetical protein
MKNRKGRRMPSCEHVEPLPEPSGERVVGLVACELCKDFVNAVVEQTRGFSRVIALHCWNCQSTVPVGDGFVVWPAAARGAP